ncbi:integral membrane protein [Stemphylium lycopersici]|uniref:Integral membrane protein n=1 Tax=Stemphylium lycopersici TaxID=183478 RepID=A0A364NEU4_STELY|nr:integral membrane protein [Stemphylium lycopersici]RAR15844.1 integral membrane protein [Stemphylium lycopersici]
MRFLAILPVLCCTAALILSFLCLFAGHKKGFMEDYSLLTLNTSAVGQTLIDSSSSSDSTVSNLINLIPDSITDGITDEINEQIDAFRERVGIEDWYSAHMLNYCQGQYTPDEVANATLSEDEISKNVTDCSKTRAAYKFDPTAIIQEAIDRTGVDVTLEDLQWPDDIQSGIDTLNALMVAMFALYVIAICLIFLTLVTSVIGILTTGRLSACLNIGLALLAFLAIGLASALVTAVMVKGTDIINDKGSAIGLEASYSDKFLAITWAATAVMLVAVIAWFASLCFGRRSERHTKKSVI